MPLAPMSRSTVQVQPNVTPMIDVMLVLLIVFMVSAPMLIAGDAAIPPTAGNVAAHPDESGDCTLAIDADRLYTVNRRPVPAAALEGEVRQCLAARPGDHVVYLRADRSLDYAVVQSTMEVAARGGAGMVGLIADLPVSREHAGGRAP